MPVIHFVTALAQEIADHVLARPLCTAGRGNRDKIPCRRQLRIETGIDRIEDFLLRIGSIHRLVPCQRIAKIAQRGSNHTLHGFTGLLDSFENRKRAHTVTGARSRHRMPGNRNILFLVIGALIVVVGVLGYNLYQTKKQPEGLQINVGPNGLKIQNK
jgi:hypothetical protein